MLCARHHLKCFTGIFLFHPHNNRTGLVLLLPPFYRGKNKYMGKTNNLAKVMYHEKKSEDLYAI